MNTKHIEQLFERLAVIYGGLWSSEERVRNPGLTMSLWRRALSNTSAAGLKRGLRWLETRPDRFPPTPGEFAQACELCAEHLGLPHAAVAYGMAATGGAQPSMPALVWHVAQEVGPFDLRTLPEPIMAPKFKRVYTRQVQRAVTVLALLERDDIPQEERDEMEGICRELLTYPAWIVSRRPALADVNGQIVATIANASMPSQVLGPRLLRSVPHPSGTRISPSNRAKSPQSGS